MQSDTSTAVKGISFSIQEQDKWIVSDKQTDNIFLVLEAGKDITVKAEKTLSLYAIAKVLTVLLIIIVSLRTAPPALAQ